MHYLNCCFVPEDLNLIKTSYLSYFDFNQYIYNAIIFSSEVSQLLGGERKKTMPETAARALRSKKLGQKFGSPVYHFHCA